LLKNPSKRTKLAKKARKRIEENYSKEKIVQNYLEKFKKHLKS
jgi:glycosyltransferase involved in cell wall biosynthesis